MIRGIIFDMDGVMFDTERLSTEGWAFAGKKMGINIPDNISVKTLGLNVEGTKNVYESYLGKDFDYYSARKIRTDYITSYIEKNGIPIKSGLIELIDYLSSNHYKMTVATSSDRSRAEYYLGKAGISEHFDKIVCGDMIEHGKPEPDIYLKASDIIGVSPCECFALEDSPMGIMSAHRAGVKPVMIPDLLQPDDDTLKLLYSKVSSLIEIIGLLQL